MPKRKQNFTRLASLACILLFVNSCVHPSDSSDSDANELRKIIGEPYASELDRIVIKTMNETGLVEAVETMASEEKQLNFASNSTIWNHGPAGELDMEHLEKLGLL